MASKRRIRRKACGDKIRYETMQKAIDALTSAKRRGIVKSRTTDHLNAYRCGFCGGYHWGHKPT